MKFNNMVAVIAIFCLAAQANAYSNGTLRSGITVAQNDTAVNSESMPTQGVVIMNTNTNSNSNSAAATAQPVTVVEASPVAESKAELMRKARQGEEVKTEQKIVEKLEESRLKEEQQRAERLFGDRLETPAAAASATAIVTPSAAAATATAVVVEPKAEPKKEEPIRATQVTIEKVEIIQPREEVTERAPVKSEIKNEEPEATSSMKIEEAQEDQTGKFYVGGLLGAPNYDASNVESHFGLGVLVGMNVDSNFVIEGSFLYSNHSVDTYWLNPLYKELDQFDFSLGAKYFLNFGKLRPYAGASVIYVYRKYQDRSMFGEYYVVNPSATEEESNSVNLGLTAGVDFAVTKKFTIGGGLDYNFNVMNRQDFRSQYGLPSGVKALEEIDYTLIKISGKMTF